MNKRIWKYCTVLLSVFSIVATIASSPSLVTARAANPPFFTDVTDAAGLYYRDETWGWAWGDYNDDGYLDLFLGHHPTLTEGGAQLRDSALMRNNGNGTFTDVIHGSGISLQEDRHDHAWIDYDDDGDLDLWVSIGARGGVGDGPKQLFRNDGDGQFVDVAAAAGVDYPEGRGRGTAWLDYDLDGDLDMYFTGAERADAPNTMFRYNGDGTFTNVGQLGTDAFTGAQSQVAVADYDNDGDPDMYVTGYGARLYRNDGGQFTSIASSAGVYTGGAASAVWGDYDNDGDLDLFVARGAQDLNGDYKEVAGNEIKFAGRSDGGDEDGLDFFASASVTFDLQKKHGGVVFHTTDVIFLGPDGHQPASNPFTLDADDVSGPPPYTPGTSEGLFIWQSESGYWHIRWTGTETSRNHLFSGIVTASTSLDNVVEIGFETPATYSLPDRLFRNQGNGTFVEVGATAGVADPQDCRSADWGDYDNDGYLDLFVQTAGHYGNNAPDLLYHNNGNGTFTNLAVEAGVSGTLDGYGWGAAWADYDNDGFLDLLTSHESWPWPLDKGRYELFHNVGNEHHWLEINLQGVQSNGRGYGAKLWITAGGMTQFREVNDNSHYFEHYAGPVHVGLGERTIVDELRVVWPSGLTQVLENVPADRQFTLVESSTPAPEADLAVTKGDVVDPVTEGDDVTYTVNVSNGGPDTAENVVLTDNLPGGVTFVSATPSQGACSQAGGVVTCNLGDIADGASAQVTIVVNTTAAGTIVNSASVAADTDDPNGVNDSDSEETTVNPSGPPTEIIVDNLDPEFSKKGRWMTSSSSSLLPYGSDFVYIRKGSGANWAMFTPNVSTPGTYEVFVWWAKCWVCASNAPYTVNHAGGSTTILVNLNDRQKAGQWNSLGVFSFNTGTSGSIVVTDNADGRLVADAIRLLPR